LLKRIKKFENTNIKKLNGGRKKERESLLCSIQAEKRFDFLMNF